MNDEKKKMIVLGALFVLILAIGAFQLTGKKGGGAKSSSAKKETPKKTDETPDLKNPQVAFNLPARDPFQPETIPTAPEPKPAVTPAPAPKVERPDARRSVSRRHNRFDDIISPMPIGGTLPEATAGSGTPVAPGARPQPQPPVKAAEPVFAYTVAGVIVGDRSAAVMRDAQGGQRLVSVGTALDADSTVTAVTKEGVTIRFRGKALRLSVGGNANGK